MTAKLIQGYEVVIGFETHAQLATQSKIFSRTSTAFGAAPNTQASAVDLALPGTLPVMNSGPWLIAPSASAWHWVRTSRRAASLRARTISTLTCPRATRSASSRFRWCKAARYRSTLATRRRPVRLVRAHLEEDAGKSLHEDFTGQSRHRPEPRRHAAAGNRHRARHAQHRGGRGLRQGAAQDRHLDWHLRRQHAGRLVPL